MTATSFAADLVEFGPSRAARAAIPLDAARAYCRRLAALHYENFQVASWLLPRRLRPHFHAVYAWCRWSDDLADEPAAAASRGENLAWWEEELGACFRGQAWHPVYVALAQTIAEFAIPQEPFRDLLSAFRQDQSISRYESRKAQLDYCRRSANPVGRLVLRLARCHDEARGTLADAVCTGLQLANFCQDVAGDWDRGRVYIPQEACRRYGYLECDFRQRRVNDAFRNLLASEVDTAAGWLQSGLPLVDQVPRWLGGDVWLFVHGGLAILDRIRAVGYDVWNRRPRVSRRRQLWLAARAWWRMRRPPPA